MEWNFPARERLRVMLVANRDAARSQIPGADLYSRKQLEKYAADIETQIAVVDSMRDEYEADAD